MEKASVLSNRLRVARKLGILLVKGYSLGAAWLLLTQQTADLEQVRKLCHRAIELDPELGHVLNDLGRLSFAFFCFLELKKHFQIYLFLSCATSSNPFLP